MSLAQDDPFGAAEFLSPWHLRERTIGLRVTRFPAGLDPMGAEVDVFRMMSRATFIRHFQERLGRSANDLLTDIRMTVAANALKTPDMPAGAVAETCRLPIRARLPARLQAAHGRHTRRVAQECADGKGDGASGTKRRT